MIDVMSDKDTYLTSFAQLANERAKSEPPWLHRIRQAAIDRFAELGFPTTRNEDWRFTNVAPIARTSFKPARLQAGHEPHPSDGPGAGFAKGRCCSLEIVNGEDWCCDNELRAEGVILEDLQFILEFLADEGPKWLKAEWVQPHLAHHARYEDSAFVALNTALFRQGAFVYVPKNTVVSLPIHLLFGTTESDEPTVTHLRNLIVVGENSQVTLLESYAGPKAGVYFTNVVTEIVAGANSVIDHYKLQREGNEAFHIATTQIHQDRASNFSSHYFGLGGALVRNEVRAALDAEGCECTLGGLYIARDQQHMDNHTVIDHARPHCASHELYKGILDGKAHGVFNGKIFVHQDAQKTDAKQTNQTLLLSQDAVINTKPQLEIYADDVKCTHGATVGQLDTEAIFYLRSRGIGQEEARNLLTYAFANDVIRRVKIEPLRAHLENLLLESQHLLQPALAKEAL
jgi:Fe-S cluster assembly protein SufD